MLGSASAAPNPTLYGILVGWASGLPNLSRTAKMAIPQEFYKVLHLTYKLRLDRALGLSKFGGVAEIFHRNIYQRLIHKVTPDRSHKATPRGPNA